MEEIIKKADVLIEALPYIQRFNKKIVVIKYGGAAMEDEARWRIENNMTAATEIPSYLDYVYLDALEEVKPEAVTIIR